MRQAEDIGMCVMNLFLDKIQRFRILKLICLLVFVLIVTVGEASDHQYLVYVGTYTGKGSEGIYATNFDPATGASSPVVLSAATDNPSFLTIDPKGRFLYAVNELDTYRNEPTGAVSAFVIDRESGKLNLLQQVSSLGKGPAHLSLDTSARFLLVANYNSGNYAVFPIGADGRLGPHSAFVQDVGSSVNPERQAGPHAHSIQVTPDNRFVLVADLGIDELLVYRFDTARGSLTPGNPTSVRVDPGAGPRHVAFALSGKFVYLVSEMGSTVTVFICDPERGTLEGKQTISTLPKNFVGPNRAAEIAVDATGRFLYVSNRGDDSIVVFSINPADGNLTALQWVSSGGKTPRHFTIDPTGKWLLVANHNSNDIRLFQIDPSSGRLTPTGRSLTVADPVCVLFIPPQ
jgi:6-phosphogluconolactonase